MTFVRIFRTIFVQISNKVHKMYNIQVSIVRRMRLFENLHDSLREQVTRLQTFLDVDSYGGATRAETKHDSRT